MAFLCETFPGLSSNGSQQGEMIVHILLYRPRSQWKNLTVVVKYHCLTGNNECHVIFSVEYSYMLLWQKDPLLFIFSVERLHSNVERKHSVLKSAHEPRLALITARATTNYETDKNEIVTDALKGKICSEFETSGFKDEAR